MLPRGFIEDLSGDIARASGPRLEIVALSRAQAKKIGDAIAVAVIRARDDDQVIGDLAAALGELLNAWGDEAPIGWRCLV